MESHTTEAHHRESVEAAEAILNNLISTTEASAVINLEQIKQLFGFGNNSTESLTEEAVAALTQLDNETLVAIKAQCSTYSMRATSLSDAIRESITPKDKTRHEESPEPISELRILTPVERGLELLLETKTLDTRILADMFESNSTTEPSEDTMQILKYTMVETNRLGPLIKQSIQLVDDIAMYTRIVSDKAFELAIARGLRDTVEEKSIPENVIQMQDASGSKTA